MKLHKFLLATVAVGALGLSTTSCRDEFSELNQNPSAVTKGNLSFLFAEAVNRFDPQPYLEYFYNAPMKYAWSGMGISTAGASEGILTLTVDGDQAGQFIPVLRVLRAMEHELNQLPEEERLSNAGYVAAANVISIYLGIFATDMYGSIPYTEACRAAYGGVLTPKYDTVEALYDEWLKQLDESAATLTAATTQMKADQDVVYKGDKAKWAKFANSLKLRIAARLLAQNEAKAKAIAKDVKASNYGYINTIDDDCRFGKGTTLLTGDQGYINDRIYHWSNGFTGCAATETVINFMVENRDPRVRFFYNKNSWNSKIVQGYYDAGLAIPEFIEKNVVSEVGADGKKKFVSWGGPGEPWVRYYGMTEDWLAKEDKTGKYRWFFPSSYANADAELYLHNKDGNNPTGYTVFSTLNQMMIIGRGYSSASHVSGATLPDDSYTFTTQDRPWTGLYMSAAEVNLYLAEFAMLNGDEGSAKTHYENALRCSAQTYDALARANQIAYYSTVQGCFGYDANEGKIDLQEGEIDTMLSKPGYAFTGSAAEKLEKIYVQQLLNFTLYPNEVFVTARRSGYPAFNSKLLPRKSYSEVPAAEIPRRFPTGTPTDDDIARDIKLSAYQQQGITPSASGMYSTKLATERLWADKNAPAWGAGRK